MTVEELIRDFRNGVSVKEDSEAYKVLWQCSQDAMRITAELNSSYHSPEQIRELMAKLTGKPIDDSFRMFPPFYTDFGKNITIGKNVFINACCCFQDQGGITIGDGALIGHRVTLATINHGLLPGERARNNVAPIVIGKNVWLGAGAILLPGVTIGDDAVVAAGAVVSKNVKAGDIVGGVPARILRNVYQLEREIK